MAIGEDSDDEDDDWILDSRSSHHLVKNASQPHDARYRDQECHLTDGETVKMLRVGSLGLTVITKDRQQKVALTEVYLAPKLPRNIMSYGNLERKDFGFKYDGK